MFTYAYDNYMHIAYPADELRPLTCDGRDTWGSYVSAVSIIFLWNYNLLFKFLFLGILSLWWIHLIC